MLTEGDGVPVAVAVDGANRHDMKLVGPTIQNIPIRRPRATRKEPQNVCLDKGYDYDDVRTLLKEFGFTVHIRSRGEEAQALKKSVRFKARRWVVERTHSWMNRFRGILIRWAKKTENYVGLLHVVCGIITWRATGLLG